MRSDRTIGIRIVTEYQHRREARRIQPRASWLTNTDTGSSSRAATAAAAARAVSAATAASRAGATASAAAAARPGRRQLRLQFSDPGGRLCLEVLRPLPRLDRSASALSAAANCASARTMSFRRREPASARADLARCRHGGEPCRSAVRAASSASAARAAARAAAPGFAGNKAG